MAPTYVTLCLCLLLSAALTDADEEDTYRNLCRFPGGIFGDLFCKTTCIAQGNSGGSCVGGKCECVNVTSPPTSPPPNPSNTTQPTSPSPP
ncbi:hypothetical protein J6590_028598 [Homalodisca vitripennis]|nr:hypothetical protein J6590_028598 [Homalodisca vitripennis]